MVMGLIENKLLSLGYQKAKGHNVWLKDKRIVAVQHSEKFGQDSIRIRWKEEWRDYHTLIFDYSPAKGPIYIMPVKDFFNNSFVAKKRTEKSYENSGYWWSQIFPTNHELVKLLLKYKECWEFL